MISGDREHTAGRVEKMDEDGTSEIAVFSAQAHASRRMHLDLTDEEPLALLNVLPEKIGSDRYPPSPRIGILGGIRDKLLEPRPPRLPLGQSPPRST
jgi:hypothetical protein